MGQIEYDSPQKHYEERYNFKFFLNQLRKVSPKAYIQYLKDTKGSGQVNIPYKDCNKLHKQIIVCKGVVQYWIYYKNGMIVNAGVEK